MESAGFPRLDLEYRWEYTFGQGVIGLTETELRCEKCGEAIVFRKDLVVTNRMFTRFSTFHRDCFQQAFRKGEYVGRPANTLTATIALAIILLAALLFYFKTRDSLVFLVLIFSPLYRLWIWFNFERKVGNK